MRCFDFCRPILPSPLSLRNETAKLHKYFLVVKECERFDTGQEMSKSAESQDERGRDELFEISAESTRRDWSKMTCSSEGAMS